MQNRKIPREKYQEDLDRGSVTSVTTVIGYGPERDDDEEERSSAEAEDTSSVTLAQAPSVLVSPTEVCMDQVST